MDPALSHAPPQIPADWGLKGSGAAGDPYVLPTNVVAQKDIKYRVEITTCEWGRLRNGVCLYRKRCRWLLSPALALLQARSWYGCSHGSSLQARRADAPPLPSRRPAADNLDGQDSDYAEWEDIP